MSSGGGSNSGSIGGNAPGSGTSGGSIGGNSPGGGASGGAPNPAVYGQFANVTAADQQGGGGLAAALAAAPMYEERRPGSGGADILASLSRRIDRLESSNAILTAKVT